MVSIIGKALHHKKAIDDNHVGVLGGAIRLLFIAAQMHKQQLMNTLIDLLSLFWFLNAFEREERTRASIAVIRTISSNTLSSVNIQHDSCLYGFTRCAQLCETRYSSCAISCLILHKPQALCSYILANLDQQISAVNSFKTLVYLLLNME